MIAWAIYDEILNCLREEITPYPSKGAAEQFINTVSFSDGLVPVCVIVK